MLVSFLPQVSRLCPGEYPTNISTLTIQDDNGSIAAAHTNIPLLILSNGSILSACNEIIITVSGYNRLNGETDTLSEIYRPAGIDSYLNSPVASNPFYPFVPYASLG